MRQCPNRFGISTSGALPQAPCGARWRVGLVLLLSLLCGGCSGCHTEPPAPPAPVPPKPPVAATVAPQPTLAMPIPPPKPMAPAAIKKYFLFPPEKPLIAYTKPGHFAGNFFVDPNTGKLAWKAMVCTAADCPGRVPGKEPPVFAIRHAYLYPLPNGDTPNLFDDGKGPQACPFCGRSQTITEYLPAEDQSRKLQLAAELKQAYDARNAARAAGKEGADGLRTPQEVMDELNAIPRHFLLDADRDYAPLEAAAQSPEPAGP